MKKHQEKPLSPAFVNLFDAMREAQSSPPADLPAAIAKLPDVGELPSPWTTWLFLSIISHHQRQKWGRQLLRRRLPEAVPPSDDLCCSEQLIECRLPGMPEWDVVVECGDPQHAFLRNRVTKEEIVVDVSARGNRPVLKLEPWNRRRQPDARTDPATRRLLELNPIVNGCGVDEDWYAIQELRDNGLIKGFHYGIHSFCPDSMGPDYFVIAKKALRHETLVLEFLRIWKRPESRIWASALIGDWLLAHQFAIESADQQLIEITAPRAEACRTHRIRMVKDSVGDDPPHTNALYALRDLKAPELDEYVRRGLSSDGWGLSVAGEFLRSSDDPKWCEEVFELWTTSYSVEHHSAQDFSCYLFRHGHRTEDAIDFIAHGRPEEAALLAMEHAPRRVLEYVRLALRWNSSEDQLEDQNMYSKIGLALTLKRNPVISMSSTLAIIDLPWTRRELVAVLSELNVAEVADQTQAISIVLALGESADEECRDIAAGWEPLLNCDDFPECRERFQEMTSHPGDRITKVWHWRPMEGS